MTPETNGYCAGCHNELAEAYLGPSESRKPCPNCGSFARNFTVDLEASVKLLGAIELKKKTPGNKRPSLEAKYGPSYHHATGTWSEIEQVVDRENDRYTKKITTEDGDIVRSDDGKLTDHQGFGSAKGTKS
jgi:hypothetical protein